VLWERRRFQIDVREVRFLYAALSFSTWELATMGLVITAYEKIERVGPYVENWDSIHDYQTVAHLCPADFPERADGIEEGLYRHSGEQHSFSAGSYSGYNAWRDSLALLAGFSSYQHACDSANGPFWELLFMSDCEGVIGPKTAAKLVEDFAMYQAQADTVERTYFTERYNEWRKVFEIAAKGGCVKFH
jgi:hypothetical protein